MEQGRRVDVNETIKECLIDEKKRAMLNDSMATTIERDVYQESLARVLLQPHIVKGAVDGVSPTYTGEGPIVIVNMVQTEKRVLHCRAFRDSLREEEETRTVRDIDFVMVRGKVRPASFSLSNVATVRTPEMNGHSFALVERARSRLKLSLATDETKIVLRAISWSCSRLGRIRWSRKISQQLITDSVSRVGLDRNPAILCSPLTFAAGISGKMFRPCAFDPDSAATAPMATFRTKECLIPVYVSKAVESDRFFVVPVGASMGHMPIFVTPRVESYDKAERLVKGWLLYQEQGIVLVGAPLANVLFFGWGGAAQAARCWLRRWSSAG